MVGKCSSSGNLAKTFPRELLTLRLIMSRKSAPLRQGVFTPRQWQAVTHRSTSPQHLSQVVPCRHCIISSSLIWFISSSNKVDRHHHLEPLIHSQQPRKLCHKEISSVRTSRCSRPVRCKYSSSTMLICSRIKRWMGTQNSGCRMILVLTLLMTVATLTTWIRSSQ